MIYKIYLDGVSIYDGTEELALIDPSLKIELNAAGSFEFTMPVCHTYYDFPRLLASDVEVYEKDELIWFGRVVEITVSMNKNKTVYCEGPFAFLNDSIQRPAIYENVTVSEFFNMLINNHNANVPINRRFTVGEITVPNKTVYRELSYNKTIDAINNMCLNAEGGYLFFRKEDGVNYIDWLSDMPYASTQPISFGLNLANISQHINGSDIKTAVLPLGKEINGAKLTINSVNDGLDYIESEAAESYGKITEVVEFSDIKYADELKAAAQNWLSDVQFDPLTIECDAAELHYLSESYSPFKVGQTVHVTSEPHLIDKELPLSKMTIRLDSGVKKISVGTPEKRELTEIYGSSNGGGTSSSSVSQTNTPVSVVPIQSQNTTVTLLASAWVGNSAPYSQTVSVSGITAADQPILDVSPVNTGHIYQWACVSQAETGDGTITFTCFDAKPALDLVVKIKAV